MEEMDLENISPSQDKKKGSGAKNYWKKKKFKNFTYSLRRYVREYCEMSSIQGVRQLVTSKSTSERIWWSVILIMSFIGSFYMVYQIFDKWLTSPVMVSLATKELPISEIPFPAVTICPEARMSHLCLNYTEILRRRQIGEGYLVDRLQNIYFDNMGLLCKSENHETTTSLITKLFGNMARNTTQTLKLQDVVDTEIFFKCAATNLTLNYCQWMGKEVKCEDVLTPILTSYGLCYSFNMYDLRDIYSDINVMRYSKESNRRNDWNPDHGYVDSSIDLEDMYPRRAFLYGAKRAFVTVFHTHKDDMNYACQDFATQGIRVTLHTPASIPRPSQIFTSVGLERLTTIAVNPQLTETSKTIRSYDPSLRNCYFGYERQLKYFKYYSQPNCNFECWTNYTLVECGCVSFYMPRENNTSICNLRGRKCIENARVNYNEDILRQRLNMANHTGGKTTACNCLPLCSDLTYNAEVATSDWDSNNDDEAAHDKYRSTISRYKASAVKVFFKRSYFLPTERNELYGLTDMISNIGGALGLITGFSIFSSAEIIYILSVKFIENYRKYGYLTGPRQNVK